MPKRIQRKRTAGWRMPEGAIYVGRPSVWGNPFDKGDPLCLPKYEQYVKDTLYLQPHFLNPLYGKDLACWCRESNPCHGDILLKLLGEA